MKLDQWNRLMGKPSASSMVELLLTERITIERMTKNQKAYFQKMQKRFSDTRAQVTVERELKKKRQGAEKFLAQMEKDVEELEAREVKLYAEKLGEKLDARKAEKMAALTAKWNAISQEFYDKVEMTQNTSETDELDKIYAKLYTTYWEEYKKIETKHLDDVIAATSQIYHSLETWRWTYRTTQRPLKLQREGVEVAFKAAADLLEARWSPGANPEGDFLLLVERMKLEYKTEWGKIKEWLRENQHRLFADTQVVQGAKKLGTKGGKIRVVRKKGQVGKKKDTPQYEAIVRRITNAFEKARGTPDKTKSEKKTLVEQTHKQVYTYLRRKKTEWQRKLEATKIEESKTRSYWWSTILS